MFPSHYNVSNKTLSIVGVLRREEVRRAEYIWF